MTLYKYQVTGELYEGAWDRGTFSIKHPQMYYFIIPPCTEWLLFDYWCDVKGGT